MGLPSFFWIRSYWQFLPWIDFILWDSSFLVPLKQLKICHVVWEAASFSAGVLWSFQLKGFLLRLLWQAVYIEWLGWFSFVQEDPKVFITLTSGILTPEINSRSLIGFLLFHVTVTRLDIRSENLNLHFLSS
jgi:hypothetical protein